MGFTCNVFLAVNGASQSHTGLSSPQNPLIQPSVGPDFGDTVSRQLADGLGEIVAEDTNNIVVQVY